jgi:hypothetical protein
MINLWMEPVILLVIITLVDKFINIISKNDNISKIFIYYDKFKNNIISYSSNDISNIFMYIKKQFIFEYTINYIIANYYQIYSCIIWWSHEYNELYH